MFDLLMLPSAYSQLLSVGIVWISFHCAGMCGPLLAGLDIGGAQRGFSIPKSTLSVVFYQFGKALTYMWMGGLLGFVGKGLSDLWEQSGSVLFFAIGLYLSIKSLWEIYPKRGHTANRIDTTGNLVSIGSSKKINSALNPAASFEQKLRRWILPFSLHLQDAPMQRSFILGIGMGFLPCMIPIWALSLAATTQSPVHGAGVMALFALMTTPILAFITILPRLFGSQIAKRWPHLWSKLSHRLPQFLSLISGVWLCLAGAAVAGWIDHMHFNFYIEKRHYMIMFW